MYARTTTLEYKDQASAQSIGMEYVEKLIPKYESLGALGLLAVRVAPRTVCHVSRYEDEEQADNAVASLRSEVLKNYSQHVVSPPHTAEGEVIGESIS